ncbi:MAG: hypothetical protein RL757_2476 [Bacteroidota bacterium]
MKKKESIIAIVILVILLDQLLKIWIKTTFSYGEERPIFGNSMPWARFNFVENPGMAFGISWGGMWGKVVLSLFRTAMIVFLVYLIRYFLRLDASRGLLLGLAAILGGAIGNMIDCAFYGLIFSASDMHHGNLATLFPEGGGYAPFLLGKVVDMFYFPIVKIPESVPLLGGHTFFEPVFNIADAAITTGVVNILLFQRRYLMDGEEENMENTPETTENLESTESETISENVESIENKIEDKIENNSENHSENGSEEKI